MSHAGLTTYVVARGGSTIGARSTNQDRYLAAGTLLGIADGVGGSVHGDLAAQAALGIASADLATRAVHGPLGVGDLLDAVTTANDYVRDRISCFGHSSTTLVLAHLGGPPAAPRARGTDRALVSTDTVELPAVAVEDEGPATGDVPVSQVTVGETALRPQHPQVLVAWAGDSYALWTAGGSTRVLTASHEVDGVLVRTVGGLDAVPSFCVVPLSAAGRLTLATDGLHAVPRRVLDAVLDDDALAPGYVVEALLDAADTYGASDNTTVVVADITLVGAPCAGDPPAPRRNRVTATV